MKRILLAFSIILSAGAFAQMATGTYAPNWEGTDVQDTNYHSLYDYLDAGKTVIIDISEVWCAPCWDYHEAGVLKDVQTNYGPGASDEMMVFMLESNPYTTYENLTTDAKMSTGKTSHGDWVTGTNYPIINLTGNDAFALYKSYNIASFPTLYMITPDRTIHAVERYASALEYKQYMDQVVEYASEGADMSVRMVSNIEASICANPSPIVSVQNYGSETISSFDFSFSIDNEEVYTSSWNGTLAPFDTLVFELPEIALEKGEHNYTATVSNPNGTTDVNTENDQINGSFNYAAGKTQISVFWKFDKNPEETAWDFKDGLNVIASDSYGTKYYGQDSAIISFCVNENDCYKLKVTDSYGDGLGDGGFVKVKQGWYTIETVEGNIATGSTVDICTNYDGIEDEVTTQKDNFFLYPNPANDMVQLQNTQGTVIEIYSMMGQLQQSFVSVSDNEKINISDLTNGIYLVKITKNNQISTLKLQVN